MSIGWRDCTISRTPDEFSVYSYYYGNISRETAEWILWDRGCPDAMFLLRDSNSDFVLSLCHNKSILHYRITRLSNGEVMLFGSVEGQRFAGIDELLEGVDGLATRPTIVCDKSKGCLLPPTHWGLGLTEIRTAIIKRTREWGIDTLHFEECPSGLGNNQLLSTTEATKALILKTLHEIQPWFHGLCARIEAEKRIEESGHKEGKFLIRERDDRSYALCVSHEGAVKHYRIDILPSGDFAIQDGQRFPSIIALVSHYTLFSDGLWCALGEPCPKPSLSAPSAFIAPNNGDIVLSTLRRNSGGGGGGGGGGGSPASGSPSLERNHNLINNRSAPGSRSNSINTVNNNSNSGMSTGNNGNHPNNGTHQRLKDWLNTINHRWSQLLSAVSPKNGPDSGAGNRLERSRHHFSTLPRHHHLMSNQGQMRAGPGSPSSFYESTDEGLASSLNFRSLNVEMTNSQTLPRLLHNNNRDYNRPFINQANLRQYNESYHYQETELFPPPTGLHNSSAAPSSRPPRRVSFADELSDGLGGHGYPLHPRLIKSSSLETLSSLSNCVLEEMKQEALRSISRTPPVPIPRKKRPAPLPGQLGPYANQEIILMHRRLRSQLQAQLQAQVQVMKCNTNQSDWLLSFDDEHESNGPIIGSSRGRGRTPLEKETDEQPTKRAAEGGEVGAGAGESGGEGEKEARVDTNDHKEQEISGCEAKANHNQKPLSLLNFEGDDGAALGLRSLCLLHEGGADWEREREAVIDSLIDLLTNETFLEETSSGTTSCPETEERGFALLEPGEERDEVGAGVGTGVGEEMGQRGAGDGDGDEGEDGEKKEKAPKLMRDRISLLSQPNESPDMEGNIEPRSSQPEANETNFTSSSPSSSSSSSSAPFSAPSTASSASAPSTATTDAHRINPREQVTEKKGPEGDGVQAQDIGEGREEPSQVKEEEDGHQTGDEEGTSRGISRIDLLKEFDVCFNQRASHSSESRKQLDAAETSGCEVLEVAPDDQDHQPEEDGYDYDALKFDKDALDKKASLGIASLDPDESGAAIQLNELDLICFEDNPEEVSKTVAKYRSGPLSLDPNYITLRKRLGNGYFGEVLLASLPSSDGCASIQVAVKLLKSHAVPNHKTEILKEAQAMASLDHKHIVRLIGVCEGPGGDPFMLVMELCPLGPLHQFLVSSGDRLTLNHILTLMVQVSMAMQYLESKQFIHRDLAARNILLVNEMFAKVSDFGMSRALGIGKEYYKARTASKWPLKWYAPECIYYFKFSTKSDVWSFGVTLWEAVSYGCKPYEGMDGQDILRLFRENRRLARPDNCPEEIYELMWNCWQFRPEDRPNFAEVCQQLTGYILCSR